MSSIVRQSLLLSRRIKSLGYCPPLINNFLKSNPVFSGIGGSRFYSIGDQFDAAQKRLMTLKESPGNAEKLKLYALFKQSTAGAVTSKRPGMMDFVGRAKWDAWNSLGSVSQDEAKQAYIDYVDSLVGTAAAEESSAAESSPTEVHYPGFDVKSDGKLKIIRFNIPEKKNAITLSMYNSFVQLLKEAENDPNTTMVALTGTGTYFSSGNDLSNLTNITTTVEEAAINGRKVLLEFVSSMIDFPKPIVAVVNGPAVGIAVTLLGLMDAVYATDRATFVTPFSALGQSPEACSSLTFPRIMGASKANEMLLFNKKISAGEAHQLGLVTQMYQDANLQAEVWPRLRELSELPVKSLVYGKQLSRQFDHELLHKVNVAECDRLLERWQSQDCMEAVMKFFSRKADN